MKSRPIADESLLEHMDHIRRIVNRVSRNGEHVDDIVQECCLRIIEKEDLCKGEGKVKQWMNAVSRNLTLNYLNKLNKEKRNLDSLKSEDNALPQEDEATPFEDQQLQWLSQAFETLSPRQRQVVEMRYYRGMKVIDIAAELGITQPMVSKHLKVALDQLRNKARYKGLLFSFTALLGLADKKMVQGSIAALLVGCLVATVPQAMSSSTEQMTAVVPIASSSLTAFEEQVSHTDYAALRQWLTSMPKADGKIKLGQLRFGQWSDKHLRMTQRLDLSHLRIDASQFHQLALLDQVHTLNLDHSTINSETLRQLQSFRHLKTLSLKSCKELSNGEIEKLKSTLKNCEIIH